MYFEVNSLSELYKIVGKYLIDNGDIVCPRGKETKEILAPSIMITDPCANLAYNKNRKFNLLYALVESLMIFNNAKDLDYFILFNKNIKNYSDDGIYLYGAYGFRASNYIYRIIEKLKDDIDTRQAVLRIYNNDFIIDTKDVPCTTTIQFLVRKNKLNMIVSMRSNDIMWGMPYDIFMFSNLQQVIANTLNLEMGWYIHNPASLHVYKEYYNMLDEMVEESLSIKVENKLKYNEFLDQALLYKNMVNSYKILNKNSSSNYFGRTKKSIIDNKNKNEYNILLLKELCYRRNDMEDEVWEIETPIWAKDFVKRWEVK